MVSHLRALLRKKITAGSDPVMSVPCSHCGLPLHRSVERYLDGQYLKSCPKCSEQTGHHVFYRAEEFGERNMDGIIRIQSWCRGCRSKHPYALDVIARCGDSYSQASEVRDGHVCIFIILV